MIQSTEINSIVMSSVVRGGWRVTFGRTRIGLKQNIVTGVTKGEEGLQECMQTIDQKYR
jgi:hypothetical protein